MADLVLRLLVLLQVLPCGQEVVVRQGGYDSESSGRAKGYTGNMAARGPGQVRANFH